jgi:hypothetical protein
MVHQIADALPKALRVVVALHGADGVLELTG